MASVYSSNYSTGTYTYTRVRVDYSGTSATAHLLYSRTNTYSGETGVTNATFTFGGVSTTFSASKYGAMTDVEVASVSFTVSGSGGTYSGSTSNGALFSFSGSVDIPAQAPTDLAISNISATSNTVTATVSVSSWSGLGDSSTRYRNLSVMATNDRETSDRRYQRVYGNTLSSAITVDNSTEYGTMTIVPNTQYWLWWFATNGTAGAEAPYTSTTTVVTLPPALSAKSVSSKTSSSLTISYTTAADGGKYSKSIQYSLDNSTWTTAATVSSASATTGTFTISGLSGYTSYTVYLRVKTTAGTTTSGSVSATTSAVAPTTPTISATYSSATANKVTFGTTSFGAPSSGTVYLYGGTSSTPTTQLTTKTTTGNTTYTHSSLTANTKYYYRALAKNSQLSSSYSSTVSQVTKPSAPTATISDITTSSAKVTITAPSMGTANTITAYYEIKESGGSYGSWVTVGTVAQGGSVSVTISGLTAGTTYYLLPNLNNGVGGTSGTEVSFTVYKTPTTPTVSASYGGATTNSVAYGTTSFGTPSSGTVYLYGGTSASPTAQIASKTSTGSSTYSHSGLTANTKYYYRSRVKNSASVWSSYSSDATTTTRPALPSYVANSLTYTKDSCSFQVSVAANGGAYTQTIRYSINGGDWTASSLTFSGSTAQTGTLTITGLAPGTQYSIELDANTSAGCADGSTVVPSFQTPSPMYGSVNGQTKIIEKLYGSVNGQTKLIAHLYGSVNGRTKKIF